MYEHALVWVTLMTLLAFVFENSGDRTRFANALQNGLVLAIIMLVARDPHRVRRPDLADADVVRRHRSVLHRPDDGRRHRTRFEPLPRLRTRLPVADRGADRHRGRRLGRGGGRLACLAHSWRPARRGHDRDGRRDPVAVPRERVHHAAPCRDPGLREGADLLRCRHRCPKRPRTEREPALRLVRRCRARTVCARASQTSVAPASDVASSRFVRTSERLHRRASTSLGPSCWRSR